MKKILCLIFILLSLFIGCGGGSSSNDEPAPNVTTENSSENTPPADESSIDPDTTNDLNGIYDGIDDFTPAVGANSTKAGYGPWNRRIRVATSSNGSSWNRQNITIADQADVPDLIVKDNHLWMFYVMWDDNSGNNIDTTVAAYSSDLVNWTYKTIVMTNLPEGMVNQVDPAIVEYAPGNYRLYFTSNAKTYSAVSTDLINWEIEDGLRYGSSEYQVLDPNLIWIEGIGNEEDHYEFFAGGVPENNHHASSTDGLSFTSLTHFVTDPFVVMANGCKIGDTYKYFGFTQINGLEEKQIRSFTYARNGIWTLDDDVLLTVDTSSGEESILVADPSVSVHPAGENSGYVMVYSTQIPTDDTSDDQVNNDNSVDDKPDEGPSDDFNAIQFKKNDISLLEEGANFPGIIFDGSKIYISYAKNNHLYLRPYDLTLNAIDSEIQVTFETDREVGSGVTDHKHIYFQNAHYLLFSTKGDDDLYLMKLDSELNRIGSITAVIEDSPNTSTNDMILGIDGTDIITGQFRPSDKNDYEISGHLIKKYDTKLNKIGNDIVANSFGHVNTASMVFVSGNIYLIAPSTPVPGGAFFTQRDLILIRYDDAWQPLDNSAIVLVDSANLPHSTQGDGIWMSTGVAYDTTSDLLLIGHTFVSGETGSDSGPLYLRVFDSSFNEIFMEQIIDSNTANRAHFLLLKDTLYVVYDDRTSSSPNIYGLTYTISRN